MIAVLHRQIVDFNKSFAVRSMIVKFTFPHKHYSNVQIIFSIHNSDEPLSKRMEKSMSADPIAPVLWPPHLEALDRRLITVLQSIRDCIKRKGAQNVLLPEDSADFTKSLSIDN